jgi:2',3'-cyclic-nucleotide 3'-phosphodiesterase
MPGSSLWLLPPESHPLYAILAKLIELTVPDILFTAPPPSAVPAAPSSDARASATTEPVLFAPHMTLTSEIPPDVYGDDPQVWLDSLPFPAETPVVKFLDVHTQDVFFRRCYVSVGYGGVEAVTATARAWGVYNAAGDDAAQSKATEWLIWWREAYGPHVSLF